MDFIRSYWPIVAFLVIGLTIIALLIARSPEGYQNPQENVYQEGKPGPRGTVPGEKK